jgi:hypothetical protein
MVLTASTCACHRVELDGVNHRSSSAVAHDHLRIIAVSAWFTVIHTTACQSSVSPTKIFRTTNMIMVASRPILTVDQSRELWESAGGSRRLVAVGSMRDE